MLKNLTIQNYALIESLDIELHDGFSVITGETGAGKSILLGAIGLLLGQRADTRAIRQGASKCVIEATFDLSNLNLAELLEELDIDNDGAECVIRRELTSAGKSRAFINDTPAPVNQLKELGEHLIDIHSQHQNLLLAKEDFQLNILDVLAHNKTLLQEYKVLYNTYRTKEREYEEAKELIANQQEEEDYISFQLNQLEEANLQEGEEEELEAEQQTLEHAEEIKRTLLQAYGALSSEGASVIDDLRSAARLLQGIVRVYPDADDLAERIESTRIELKDIASELEDAGERIEFNPARQQYVDERLSLIYDLEHKHHVDSITELLALAEELSDKLHTITHSEEHLEKLRHEMELAEAEMKMKGIEVTNRRMKVSREVEKMMVEMLVPLGMPNIRFKVEFEQRQTPNATGFDNVTFLFNANKNTTLQPISQIASGGEIARVMLALKALISSATSMPTIIFDEIDTGVSGQIAERMALIMQKMCEAKTCQVISITHLPQIASLGSHHYKVYKEDNDDQTNSHIVELNSDQRIEEIAHMLSGATLTEAALNNARELLKH